MYPQLKDIQHDSFKTYLHNTDAQSMLLKLTRSLIIRRLQQRYIFHFKQEKHRMVSRSSSTVVQ